jgi:hypothetical protein
MTSTTQLCDRGCTIRGSHLDGCTVERCTGCLPALAAPGLRLCWPDVQGVRTALGIRGATARRADDASLPELWDDVEDAGVLPARASGGRGDSTPALPVDDGALAWRTAVRSTLVAWCRILEEDLGVRLGDARDEVPWMVRHVAWSADRLLAHPEHADQLAADLLGWTETSEPSQDGTGDALSDPDDAPGPMGHPAESEPPRRHAGLIRDGRRLAYRSRGAAVRIRCSCGHRIPVPTDSDGRIDTDTILRCGGCGEHGVLDWWRRREAASPEPLALRDLPEWLATVHGLAVTSVRLRRWADEGVITPIDRVPNATGGRPRRLFDPVAVAVVVTGRCVATHTG